MMPNRITYNIYSVASFERPLLPYCPGSNFGQVSELEDGFVEHDPVNNDLEQVPGVTLDGQDASLLQL